MESPIPAVADLSYRSAIPNLKIRKATTIHLRPDSFGKANTTVFGKGPPRAPAREVVPRDTSTGKSNLAEILTVAIAMLLGHANPWHRHLDKSCNHPLKVQFKGGNEHEE